MKHKQCILCGVTIYTSNPNVMDICNNCEEETLSQVQLEMTPSLMDDPMSPFPHKDKFWELGGEG